MLGSFNQKSLELFQEAMSKSMFSDFSEGESYDFTTCIRPDGSAYGTGGKCRKGTEGKAKEKEAPKRSQVDLVTPQKQGHADVDRMKKYFKDESDKLKNLNDAQKQNPSRSNDPDVVSRKKVLERNIAAVEKQLKDLERSAKLEKNIEKEEKAKKPEAPLRGQNLANKMMDHVNISNRVAANHGGAIRTKAAKEEHAAELKKAGVPDRATLTAALKAQRDEAKKPQ